MFSSAFLPLPAGLEIATTTMRDDLLVVQVVSTKVRSCCPLCFCPAERRHSHYTRVVADLPCAGFRVQLILHVRRFFCDTTDCIRKIFTERLPAFVLPWARLTVRLCEALQSLGLATCGELGTRLAERLALQTSPTTILRRLMVLPTASRNQAGESGSRRRLCLCGSQWRSSSQEVVQIGFMCSKTSVRLWREYWHVIWPLIGPA